jgi:hypothetical protein
LPQAIDLFGFFALPRFAAIRAKARWTGIPALLETAFQQSYPQRLWIAEKPPQNPAISRASCEGTLTLDNVRSSWPNRVEETFNTV